MISRSAAVTRRARRAPAAVPEGGGSLLTRPGFVVAVVLVVWTVVPALVARPKVVWGLTGVLLLVVLNAIWRHARELRGSAPLALLALVYACSTLSSGHYGTVGDVAGASTTALLLLGCGLLAANSGREDTALIARAVVLVALVQLVIALASAHLGVPAPWGYEGKPGTTFSTNMLVPALGGRSTGTMAHPIPFGTLMAVAVALCTTRATRWPLAVRLAGCAAGICGVAMSGTRSAALALAVALVAALIAPGVLRVGPVWRTVGALVLAIPLLTVNLASLSIFTSLQGTGSLTHRLGALDAAVRLAGRPLDQFLVGSGADSLRALFSRGLLQLDGFFAVDNQLVTTFAQAGLVGVLALAGAVVRGLWCGDRVTRPAALPVVLMFASFDVLQWNATAFLGTVLLVLGTAVRRSPDDSLGDTTGAPTALPVREGVGA